MTDFGHFAFLKIKKIDAKGKRDVSVNCHAKVVTCVYKNKNRAALYGF